MNFNALQRHIRIQKPLRNGVGSTVRLPIEGIANFEQLKSLIKAGETSGHWIITRDPPGSFTYVLTAEGVALLEQE